MRVELSELKPGSIGTIVSISGENPLLSRRITEMGMSKGEEVKVVRNAPLKDPIEFEVKGFHLSLKRDEAKMIIVEVNESVSPRHGT